MTYFAIDKRDKSGPGIERVGHILNSLEARSFRSTHEIYNRVGSNITDRKTLEKDLRYCNETGLIKSKEEPYRKGKATYHSITELGIRVREMINQVFLRRKYTSIVV